MWDDEKQAKLTQLQESVTAAEKTLAKGGIALRKAKEVALEMQKTRLEMRNLLAARTSLDNHSAEGQADNARFNFLVSCCVVYKDSDKKYFDNLKAYLENADDPVAIEGAQALANMLYGLDNDFEKNLPENKFLRKYKFVDENLRFINKEGNFVDSEGRLVNEDGQYINEAGERVDRFGNLLDEEGEMIVESKPFLDDDGEPVILEDKKENEDKEEKQDAKKESTTTAESSD